MSKSKDTLEQIVEEAIEREKELNKDPARHGLGMMEHEADDFIRRIEALERKQELAQREKSRRLYNKIRLVGKDKLYTMSPVDVLLSWETKVPVDHGEQRAVHDMTRRQERIYDMYCRGMSQTSISLVLGIHQSTVSRDIAKIRTILKENIPNG